MTGTVSLGNAPYLWRALRDIQLYARHSLQRFSPPTLLGKRVERNGTKHPCFIISCIPLPLSLPPMLPPDWIQRCACPCPRESSPLNHGGDPPPWKAVSSPLLPACRWVEAGGNASTRACQPLRQLQVLPVPEGYTRL